MKVSLSTGGRCSTNRAQNDDEDVDDRGAARSSARRCSREPAAAGPDGAPDGTDDPPRRRTPRPRGVLTSRPTIEVPAMTTTLPPDHDRTPPEQIGPRRRLVVAALAVTALVLGVVIGVLALRPPSTPGDGLPTAPPATGSAPAATTSSPPPSTAQPTPTGGTVTATPTAPRVPADAVTAVWPTGAVPTRYTDPVAAARGFALDMAAFADPVVGAFLVGDSRSGEVDVRPAPDGPVTTVFVRLLGDGTWWVLGAATADLTLDSPAAGDLLAGAAELSGTALAFEGTVDVRIVDDTTATLATGVVTGGGDVARPFRGEFPLDGPAAPYGTLLLTTASGADGSTWTASAVRVRLAP